MAILSSPPHPSSAAPAVAYRDSVASALTALVDLSDAGTGRHSTAIVKLAIAVGAHFGWSTAELRELEIAASLHDLGKVGVPEAILGKQKALDPDEAALMHRHPEYGWAVLRQIPGFENIALYILHHHERWDGAGYPGELRAEAIPLGSRILAVVDAFHAMTDDRPYRKGMPLDQACQRLCESAGSQFDPAVVEVFVDYARRIYSS